MIIYIVISKQTGHIMAAYTNYTLAAKSWLASNLQDMYSILEIPITIK